MPSTRANSNTDSEQRLTNLETQFSFQEDAIDQLSMVIYRQQQHIDWLLQEVRRLGEQAPEGGSAPRNPQDERPPHY